MSLHVATLKYRQYVVIKVHVNCKITEFCRLDVRF